MAWHRSRSIDRDGSYGSRFVPSNPARRPLRRAVAFCKLRCQPEVRASSSDRWRLVLGTGAVVVALVAFSASASPARADWYVWHQSTLPGSTWEGFQTYAYADLAEITPNDNQPNGYVCSGGTYISWTCGWDSTTNNWNYWRLIHPECQNGEWYGFSMDCYVFNGL